LAKLFERAGFEVIEVRGKTILPIRQNKQLLAGDEGAIERLIRIEMELNKDPSASGRAGHLQIVARKPVA
jgi:hypothetical protein